MFSYYLAIFFRHFLKIFDPIEKFAGTKIFQFFRSWVFADRRSDNVSISVQGLLQKCHPSFLNFRTNELQVSIKNLFWTRLCSWGCFWYNLAGDNNSLEDNRKTILLKVTYITEHFLLYKTYLHVMKEIPKELTDPIYAYV